jgi:hypothetical protein
MARIPNHQMIAIAAKAKVGLKGMRGYSAGTLQRQSTIAGIENAIRQLGLEHLLRPQDAPAKVIDEAMTRLPAHQLRQISAAAACDPSSVRKYVGDKPLRMHVVLRIEAALRMLGLVNLIRDAAPPPSTTERQP